MTLTTTSPSFKSASVGMASDLSVLKVSGSIGPLGREWRMIRVLVFAGILGSLYGSLLYAVVYEVDGWLFK
jgi:hypothetical protein